MVTVPSLNNGDAPIEQLPGPSSRKARHVPLLYHSSKVSACLTNARCSTLHSRGPSTSEHFRLGREEAVTVSAGSHRVSLPMLPWPLDPKKLNQRLCHEEPLYPNRRLGGRLRPRPSHDFAVTATSRTEEMNQQHRGFDRHSAPILATWDLQVPIEHW
jgi:hypothetical protein